MTSLIDDNTVNINDLKRIVNEFVDKRKWNKYHTPKNLIQAIGIEVAELSELFLFKEPKIEEIIKDSMLMEDISDEVSDIFIYLLSLINILGIDLTKAFLNKMKKNNQKYPFEEFNDGSYVKK